VLARAPVIHYPAIVLDAVYASAGTVQRAVQLASFALGVTTVTPEAPVHSGNLSLVLAYPFQFAVRDFARFPTGTGTGALIGQASVDTPVKSPVLRMVTLTVPLSLACDPAPLTPRVTEVPAVEFAMVSLVTPARILPGFAAINRVLASITPRLAVFGLTALIAPVVGTLVVTVTLIRRPTIPVSTPRIGRITVLSARCLTLAPLPWLTAVRLTPLVASLAAGFCCLRGLLATVAACRILRVRDGRYGQPERGCRKQRDHDSWIIHCVFSHSSG
jgi:hypothetical protein